MAKRYLGRTTELTPARLEEVAAQLAEAALARSASRAEMSDQRVLTSQTAPLPSAMATREASSPPPNRLQDVRLATKLHMPRLRTKLVHRNHLIEQLQQGREAQLTLISTPAGFGKTMLLAQWLEVSGRDAAWLSLEPEDNEPTRFLSSMIAALQTLDPHLGRSALALLHTTPPAPPPPPEAVLAQLAAEFLERAQRDLILVLDDYHVITTASLQRTVAALMEHPPPQRVHGSLGPVDRSAHCGAGQDHHLWAWQQSNQFCGSGGRGSFCLYRMRGSSGMESGDRGWWTREPDDESGGGDL